MIAQCKTTLVSRTRIPQRGICKKAPKISADRTRPRTILCTMERPSMEAISHDATRAAHPASAPAAVLASPAPAPDSPTLRAPSTLRTARPPRPLLVPQHPPTDRALLPPPMPLKHRNVELPGASSRRLPALSLPPSSPSFESRNGASLGNLEAGMRTLMLSMQAVQSDLMEMKQRLDGGTADAPRQQSSSDSMHERVAAILERTHAIFAKKDEDGNGVLDSRELAPALNAIGSLEGGMRFTESDCASILESYDVGNGVLNADEFVKLVFDLVRDRRFIFHGDLKDDVQSMRRENAWDLSSHDTAVRHMIDGLRGKQFASAQQEAADRDRGGVCDWLCFRCSTACNRVLPVLNPDGPLRLAWNAVMVLLIVYCSVGVPLEIAFEPAMKVDLGPDGWSSWQAFNLAMDLLFIIDLAMCFRTSYFVEGRLERDGAKIAKNCSSAGIRTLRC